jgi:hypothetical protein
MTSSEQESLTRLLAWIDSPEGRADTQRTTDALEHATARVARQRPYHSPHLVRVPHGERGPWRVEPFVVTAQDAWRDSVRALLNPHRPDRATPVGVYTRLVHAQRGTVMSDTPAEIEDHLPALAQIGHRSCRRVLIHGLGLGMVLQHALRQPHVAHVDVVEIDPDVIALVGPRYLDPRLVIHEGDAFTYRFPPHTRWDVCWHDIWDSITADNLPEMHHLHRRYGTRVGWQGSWGRALAERPIPRW